MIGFTPLHRAAARLACLAIFVSLAAGQETPVTPHPEERFSDWGRETHSVPTPSNVGVWDGTWFYVNRDVRLALWIKTETGKPRVKLRYTSMNSGEGFETDWNGKADYEVRDANGSFTLGIERRDADLIEGRWEWLLTAGRSVRLEEGDYRIYRTGDGRFMAFTFDAFTKTIRSGGKDEVYKGPLSWTFRKASKRLVRWDELPF